MYKAVIFDLYGTLVDMFRVRDYEEALRRISSLLGTDYEELRRVWHEASLKRNTGKLATTRIVMENLCDELGIQANDEMIQQAVDIRLGFVRKVLKPRYDAVPVLKILRMRGIRTALLSNCSPDTEEVWHETPFAGLFDAVVFSSSVGMKKPYPEIYYRVLKDLGMKAEDCVFVGDGDGNELTGAKYIGLHAVQIAVDYEPEDAMTDRQEWNGPVISSLSEIVKLVEAE